MGRSVCLGVNYRTALESEVDRVNDMNGWMAEMSSRLFEFGSDTFSRRCAFPICMFDQVSCMPAYLTDSRCAFAAV